MTASSNSGPTDGTKSLRAGGDLPNLAIDPHTGYEGSDFSGGAYDSVELIHSTDGGRTLSPPGTPPRPLTPEVTSSMITRASLRPHRLVR
ncbi:hypothetical protein ACWC2T_12935 [Streptomyces sp. NPDC001393]